MALTGRLFKCLSLKGLESKQVVAWFDVGKVYRECDKDVMDENLNDNTTFLLYTNLEFPLLDDNGEIIIYSPMFYVSAMDFELIPIIQEISLN